MDGAQHWVKEKEGCQQGLEEIHELIPPLNVG
jgi:hypothetical protein